MEDWAMKCYDKECKSRDLVDDRKLVIVKWHDAAYQDGPIYIEDINTEYILETVGHLVFEDDNHIAVAGDWHSRKNSWRHVTHIPKDMIKIMVKISKPEMD